MAFIDTNKIMTITMPEEVSYIITQLNNAGYEAYAVGGCVRDILLGLEPKDWDICTSALPNQVNKVFEQYRIVLTGVKYGTSSVIINDRAYEITTFRKDGDYDDNRHPSSVVYTESIEEDLSRRDFTVNAMAYNPSSGLIDPCGGVKDLANMTLRCVGISEDRFNEDALRILRALRFASTYGFQIDQETSEAIHKDKILLYNIAPERIHKELLGILHGGDCARILNGYSDVICVLIPEMKECVGFDQNNPYHVYNVYEHTVHALAHYNGGTDDYIALALLLHDIGKPVCYTEDERGGHFYGHAEVSAEIAKTVLTRLRFDARTVDKVTLLVRNHNDTIYPSKKSVRKWLNRVGESDFARLLELRRADILAHKPETQTVVMNELTEVKRLCEEVLAEQSCFTLRNLAINGKDIILLGVKEGKAVGILLKKALDAVMEEKIENDREALLEFVRLEITNAIQHQYGTD